MKARRSPMAHLPITLLALMVISLNTVDASRALKQITTRPAFAFVKLDGMGCNGPTLSRPFASNRQACEDLCGEMPACMAYSFALTSSRCYLKALPCEGSLIDTNPDNLSGNRVPVISGSSTRPPASPRPFTPPASPRPFTPPPSDFNSFFGPSAPSAPSPVRPGPSTASGNVGPNSVFDNLFGGVAAPPGAFNDGDEDEDDYDYDYDEDDFRRPPSRAPVPRPPSRPPVSRPPPSSPPTVFRPPPSSSGNVAGVTRAGGRETDGNVVTFTIPTTVTFERLESGVGCRGSNLDTLDVRDRVECENECGADSGCMAYSFNVESRRCFLKEEPCTGRNRDVRAGSNLSGNRVVEGRSATIRERVFSRLDFIGCNGRTLREQSAEFRGQCEDMCRENEECMAYSFALQSRKCFLKAEPCDASNQDTNADNLSGSIVRS